MTNNNIKLLIMDFDGTIAETLDDVVWCMGKTFEGYGFPAPDYSSVHATVGLTLEDSFRTLSKNPIPPEKIDDWVNAYRTLYKKEGGTRTRLFLGMKESMQEVSERGVKLLVVSNKGMAAIQAALSKLSIEKYVDRILSGDTVTHKKPDPELFNLEIKPLYPTLNDNEIMVVGDTHIDLEFARNAGLQSCWVTYGYGKPDQCRALSPTHIIKNANELAGIVIAPASMAVTTKLQM